jgi:hypothetical protein
MRDIGPVDTSKYRGKRILFEGTQTYYLIFDSYLYIMDKQLNPIIKQRALWDVTKPDNIISKIVYVVLGKQEKVNYWQD